MSPSVAPRSPGLGLKKGPEGSAVLTRNAKSERASVVHLSLQQLPVFSVSPPSHGKCLPRVFIHIQGKKKQKILHWPQSWHPLFFFFFVFKSPSFFIFDLSTRCLTYAQQSTIVTRNRNFVSMVLIKYPHQYREEERKRGGAEGLRGGERR